MSIAAERHTLLSRHEPLTIFTILTIIFLSNDFLASCGTEYHEAGQKKCDYFGFDKDTAIIQPQLAPKCAAQALPAQSFGNKQRALAVARTTSNSMPAAAKPRDFLQDIVADKETQLPPVNTDLRALVAANNSAEADDSATAEQGASGSRSRHDLSVPPPLPLLQFPSSEADVFAKAGDGKTLKSVHHIMSSEKKHGREPLRTTERNKWLGKWFEQRDILERSIVQGERGAPAAEVIEQADKLQWQLIYGEAKSVNRLWENAEEWRRSSPQTEPCLAFSADFESANLGAAYRVFGRESLAPQVKCLGEHRRPSATEYEYDLFCRPDVHTAGHVQWFYFRVRVLSAQKSTPIRFNIVNMVKSDSLFSRGMKPAVYSEYAAQRHGVGWRHIGRDVAYYKNLRKQRKRSKRRQTYYSTLSFRYDVEYEGDTLYFAYCFPYTYSDLQQRLAEYEKNKAIGSIFRRKLLCRTLGGNRCDIVTITSYVDDPRVLERRPVVVCSARVHPGETNSSYVIQGLMDYLLSLDPAAARLRDALVFKIVPMLNPDGVINGSYRCSLAGVDLNRRYDDPSPMLHPTIRAFKEMMLEAQNSRGILLYVDIHGHSRKKNAFVYGCDVKRATRAFPTSTSSLTAEQVLTQRVFARVFPFILCSTSDTRHGGFFAYEDCSFTVQPSKLATARVVAWHALHISAAYTVEVSLCGSGENAPKPGSVQHRHMRGIPCHHYSQNDLVELGASIGRAVLHYANLCDKEGTVKAQTVVDTARPDGSLASQLRTVGGGEVPVADCFDDCAILAPCVLSKSSQLRLEHGSLRAHAERTLQLSMERLAEAEASDDCCNNQDDNPLMHGLLRELREREKDSSGSDSDPSVDNLPVSTLHSSKEWLQFCSNAQVGISEDAARTWHKPQQIRQKARASGGHQMLRGIQRAHSASRVGRPFYTASRALQIGGAVAGVEFRRRRRGLVTSTSGEEARAEHYRRANSVKLESQVNQSQHTALHPRRAAMVKKAKYPQRQLFAVASVGSIDTCTEQPTEHRATSAEARPLHTNQMRCQIEEPRNTTLQLDDVSQIARARGCPTIKARKRFNKHVPIQATCSPRSSISHGVKFPPFQPPAAAQTKIKLRPSNATSEGFPLQQDGDVLR